MISSGRVRTLREAHFKERRIPVATGIRMVLIEYLKKQAVLK